MTEGWKLWQYYRAFSKNYIVFISLRSNLFSKTIVWFVTFFVLYLSRMGMVCKDLTDQRPREGQNHHRPLCIEEHCRAWFKWNSRPLLHIYLLIWWNSRTLEPQSCALTMVKVKPCKYRLVWDIFMSHMIYHLRS